MKIDRDTFSRTLKDELSRIKIIDLKQAYWEKYALTKLISAKNIRNRQKTPKRKSNLKPYLLRRLFYLNKAVPDTFEHKNPNLNIVEIGSEGRKGFLRGTFLANGSLISPVRGHHLEIVLPTHKEALLVKLFMTRQNFKCGLVKRRSAWVVYLKGADQISEFIAFLGGSRSVLQYENIRVQKSIKSSVQRQVNMDKANVSRSVESCLKQIEDILLIERELGLNHLPKALREIAEARLNNEALTMQELGQSLNPPITKSAVNHRLRRISKTASRLREQKNKEQHDHFI